MQFYEEGNISNELAPDWDYWNKFPILNLEKVSFLMFNIDHNHYGLSHTIPNDYLENILKIHGLLSDYVNRDMLHEIDLRHGYGIAVSELIVLLDKESIPFPKELRNVVTSTKQLTSKDISSLTQQNTTLKLFVKELISFHYGKNVSAYRIAQDINISENTIKNYMD